MSLSLGLSSRIGDILFFNKENIEWRQLPDGYSVLVAKDINSIRTFSKIHLEEDTIEGRQEKYHFLVDSVNDSIQIYTEPEYLELVRVQLEHMLEMALCG